MTPGSPATPPPNPPGTPPTAGTLTSPPQVVISKGSARFTAEGQTACLPDDIESMEFPATYAAAPPYTVPGAGTVKFKLRDGHKTKKTSSAGKPVVIYSGPLDYELTVKTPAQMPNPAVPPTPPMLLDPMGTYTGIANFAVVVSKPVTAC
ncbi:hypothetical protein [Streptomyces vinaceus]|uniref:hypothetical protein n=1 Tax=Streptomyces vinaceus TaxID=1960 RepID=UPI0036CAC4FA